MKGAFLLEVSKRIKYNRKKKHYTLQELASRANVSKGLISQIENGRTIPSLSVLFNIIQSLDMDVGDFFNDIQTLEPTIIIQRKEDYEEFVKEDIKGYSYKRILTKNLPASTVDLVLLDISPGTYRQKVKTDAYEYKYILKGEVNYMINGSYYHLKEGDSLFFDGRLPHVPENTGDSPCSMLVVYFFSLT
jgi:transcriptional regulator with XRE-family HTH domain